MANIPIVDFSAFVDGFVDGDRAKVAKEIDEAFRNAGFVYLKNHGVPQSQVKECFSWVTPPFASAVISSTQELLNTQLTHRTVQDILRPSPLNQTARSTPTRRQSPPGLLIPRPRKGIPAPIRRRRAVQSTLNTRLQRIL